jgi:hypothetical protein
LITGLETLGLWLAGALWSELARLGELWIRLLARLEDVNGRALHSLTVPLVLWIALLSAVATYLLFSAPARLGAQRPIGRAR